MKLSGWYDLKKNGTSIICFPSDSVKEYDSQDAMFNQSMFIIVVRVSARDLPFLFDMMQISREQHFFSFSIMDILITNDVLKEIIKTAEECFPNHFPQLVIPVNLATRVRLPNDVFVGSFMIMNNITYAQSFNAASLDYLKFKSVLPEAKRIGETIRMMGLNDLESIIWIDNWFQKNIQYIQDKESCALGEIYVCPKIDHPAKVPDVFLNHYGTCEDISVSIASILSMINIDYHIVQADEHAWLLVNLFGKYYIWDCTRNITRNPCRMENALKALAYSSEYTLIGSNKYPDDYPIDSNVLPKASIADYPKEEVLSAITTLSQTHQILFLYEEQTEYYSFKK